MAVATETRPADVGLKREMGLIGATWASETSIIGSGWLFAPLTAALLVGGGAVVDWIIAGVVVILLALCHAELGGMYPVSGGTARFPHFAFGSVAGIGFGFFSYVQAVTIAPIECYAFVTYASYYWPSLFNADTGKITGVGLWVTVGLMAVFTAVNFLAMRLFNRVNIVVTWWKVAIPVLTIIVLLFKFHPGNFTAGGAGFFPGGIKGLTAALPVAGIIFAYSGFEQADQLAGEIKNPGRNLPRSIIICGPDRHRDLHHAADRVHRRAAPRSGRQWAAAHHQPPRHRRAVRRRCGPRRARLAGAPPADRRVRLPVRHRPHLHDRNLADQLRPGQEPVRPADLRQDRRQGCPMGRADLRVPVRAAVPAAVPELALAGWRDHRRERAHVLRARRCPWPRSAARCRRRTGRTGCRPLRCSPRIAFVIADLLIYWSGFEVVWKLGIVLVIGYVLIGISMAFDKDRPPLDWKSAVWLPVWLVGMGIISWQGQYSGGAVAAPLNTNHIPFWWDMVIVAAFSLVIFYWAMATKLPREEMMNLVNRQGGENAEPAPGS